MKNGGLREENFETRRNFSEKKDKRRKKSQKGGNIPKGGQLVALLKQSISRFDVDQIWESKLCNQKYRKN